MLCVFISHYHTTPCFCSPAARTSELLNQPVVGCKSRVGQYWQEQCQARSNRTGTKTCQLEKGASQH
ncbi:hypothetical protein XELAEV_18038333mg [Xenopus laevis]|uniref:Uncharacterized protein n=1 Tax=Xenopus laevis TaxID=8355 RepID=A0A974H7D3_XENLA|nr:hypothetical protein XELAEV_18038333mg [Xenopus laevis]